MCYFSVCLTFIYHLLTPSSQFSQRNTKKEMVFHPNNTQRATYETRISHSNMNNISVLTRKVTKEMIRTAMNANFGLHLLFEYVFCISSKFSIVTRAHLLFKQVHYYIHHTEYPLTFSYLRVVDFVLSSKPHTIYGFGIFVQYTAMATTPIFSHIVQSKR